MIKILKELQSEEGRNYVEDKLAGKTKPSVLHLPIIAYFLLGFLFVALLAIPALNVFILIGGIYLLIHFLGKIGERNEKTRNLVWSEIIEGVFPGAEYIGADFSNVKWDKPGRIIPRAGHYSLSACIKFHDEFDTELYQIYAYDERTDDKGNTTKDPRFFGPVFQLKCSTGITGDSVVKIQRTKTVLGKETDTGRSKGIETDNLEQFETEDVFFNENYNTYCDRGNIGSRVFLNPAMLVGLDEWAKKHDVGTYIMADAEGILIGFDLAASQCGVFSYIPVTVPREARRIDPDPIEVRFYKKMREVYDEPFALVSSIAEHRAV